MLQQVEIFFGRGPLYDETCVRNLHLDTCMIAIKAEEDDIAELVSLASRHVWSGIHVKTIDLTKQ